MPPGIGYGNQQAPEGVYARQLANQRAIQQQQQQQSELRRRITPGEGQGGRPGGGAGFGNGFGQGPGPPGPPPPIPPPGGGGPPGYDVLPMDIPDGFNINWNPEVFEQWRRFPGAQNPFGQGGVNPFGQGFFNSLGPLGPAPPQFGFTSAPYGSGASNQPPI